MSSFNYEKALSLDWNGQVFVLTVRGETPLAYNYLYSYDGTNWTTSRDLSNSAVLVNKNPYNVKWTGSNYTMIGNLSTSSGSTLLSSKDGIKYSALTTSNLTAPLYDLETNLEFPHTITFPRNMTLALGGAPADTTKIAYSLDEGITWTPSSNSSAVFTSTANNAVWNGKTWVAVGSGGNTIATSTDANNWVGRGSYIFTTAGYGLAWSREQTQWVACGTGTNSLAYSPDGVFWTAVNNSSTNILSTVYDVKWNGTIWLATGIPISGNKSIAYSYDGRSWSLPSQTNLFDISGIKLTWNGSMWTAIGRSTAADASSNIATSIDGVIWKVFYNSNLYFPNLRNLYSDPITKKTLIIQNAYPPSVPTGLTASSATISTITYTFTASTGAVSYTATAVPTSGSTVVQTGITSSPVTITGLQTNMPYNITMIAINTGGSSATSSSLVYSTSPAALYITNLTIACSVRLVVPTYTGPIFKLRISTSTTQDFYTDKTQSYISTGPNNTGTSFASWVGGNTAYVHTLYNQTEGSTNHAVNSTNNTTQPTFVLQSGKYVMNFVASNRPLLTLATAITPNTIFTQFTNSNKKEGTVFSKESIGFGLRLGHEIIAPASTAGTRINGDSNNGDWFWSSSGSKIAYNNGSSINTSSGTTLLTTTTPQWNLLSLSTQTTSTIDLKCLGYDQTTSEVRGMNGYMVEMICHNTSKVSEDMIGYYNDRLI